MTKKCIIVSGASRGIGAAIALRLAQDGFVVGCLSRSAGLPETGDVEAPVRARWIGRQCDVADPASFHAALSFFAGQGLSIVGLVNNAGVHLEGSSHDFPLDQWRQVIDTNATSVLAGCQAAFPHLVRSGGGLIVNIGSFFEKLGVKRNVAYCASKAAVGAITRCLAVEWAKHHIKVLDVAPGYIQTDLNKDSMASGPLRAYLEKRIPAGVPGTSDDIAKLVAALFQLDSGFLTGETIYVDGGQGVAH